MARGVKNLPPGASYVEVPGMKTKRVRLESGEVVSRRQGVRNWAAQQDGYNNQSHKDKIGKAVGEYLDVKTPKQRTNLDYQLDLRQYRSLNPDKTLADFERERAIFLVKANENDNSPNGSRARYLMSIGRRDPDDWWDVGDTP